MSELINNEVQKWSKETKRVIDRLAETLSNAKAKLKFNQDLFNETIHHEEFNPEKAVAYIHAMNNCIESIKSLEALLHATKIGKKAG